VRGKKKGGEKAPLAGEKRGEGGEGDKRGSQIWR